ncbi:MAG: hypothetical protein U5K36_07230 [Roseovarius sp.]|nr:hypothetical protein [Roseovarius sp.]
MFRGLATLSPEARGLSITGGAIVLTLIAAGGDALRGPAGDAQAPVTRIAAPLASDRLSVTMAAPVTGSDSPVVAHGSTDSGPGGPDMAVPRLAALSPPEGEGAATRVSRLSRIFRGPPPVVPPERPAPEPRDATAHSDGAMSGPLTAALRPRARPEAQPPRQYAVLRPRVRPEGLKVTVASATTVVARRPAPQDADVSVDPPRQQTALPAAPRIVRASGRCPARLSREMPRRARNAAGASAVMARLKAVDGVTRDSHVTREMLSGNMPEFLRNLRPVSIRGLAADGSTVVITICVTPDYLALGSDADNVRIPLGLRAATRIGDAFNMLLPTPRMVDLIYRGADVRLSPRPMPAGPQMRSTDYLMQHDATVDNQRRRAGAAPGTLISGHKKDVVLTTRLAAMPGRVAIYGWHRANGQPIQPLSTVHGAGYADYSHGVRLVSRTAFLDGKPVDLRSLMASPLYAGLLSDEGPVTGPRLRMAALAAN